MPAQNVEIVFVIDTSESMQPYIDGLKDNLKALITPLQQTGNSIRFGLVAHSVTGHGIYTINFLNPCNSALLKQLYSGQCDINNFFTSDQTKFKNILDNLSTQGDEDTPLALDIALDFPFGPLQNTRRVIAFFSDERIEDGEMAPNWLEMIPKLVDKAIARKVLLFGFIPKSPAALTLSEAERSEMFFWDTKSFGEINFTKLLSGMGKSISISSMQATKEPDFTKALFGQDSWGDCYVDKSFHDKFQHSQQ